MAKKTTVAAGSGAASSSVATGLGKAIEDAMAKAVLKANEDGIPVTDSEEISKRMNAARMQAKEDWLRANDASAAGPRNPVTKR